MLLKTSQKPFDYWLLLSVILLLGFGILMVYSTTAIQSQQDSGDSFIFLKKHLVNILVASVFFLLSFKIKSETLYKLAVPFLLFSIILLAIILIPGIGYVAGGARRWLLIGPLRIQPGEIAKLSAIIYFASYIERQRTKMHNFKSGVLFPLIILGLFALTLLLEPDFGSTVVILLVVFGQLFIFCRPLHLLAVLLCTLFSFAVLIIFSPYRLKRMLAFLDPFADYNSSGYQLIQSLTAVGSGGLEGLGLGSGQQKLFYLPAAHTDFIFAVIAEELGILGAILVLLLFLLIMFRGMRISKNLMSKPFLSSLALGCTLLMVIPALLNMGVVLGMLPTKGLVLPLVAYGGTSILVHLVAMGILLRLSTIKEVE